MSTALAEPTTDLNHLFVVQRGGWDAEGILRERGEVLNTRGWRNYRGLVESRYLAPAEYDLLETMQVCACGRKWASKDDEAAHNKGCPAIKKGDD